MPTILVSFDWFFCDLHNKTWDYLSSNFDMKMSVCHWPEARRCFLRNHLSFKKKEDSNQNYYNSFMTQCRLKTEFYDFHMRTVWEIDSWRMHQAFEYALFIYTEDVQNMSHGWHLYHNVCCSLKLWKAKKTFPDYLWHIRTGAAYSQFSPIWFAFLQARPL